MEKKTFQFEIKSFDDETGTFEGYAAIFGSMDYGGDVIEKGAFKKTLKEHSSFPILWQHDSTKPIGLGEASEDDTGLYVKGKLNQEVQQAKEAYALIKQGALKGLSIGYSTIQDAWENSIRKLKEVKLYEYSPVTFPMNPLAGITGVKSMEDFSTKTADVATTLQQSLQEQELRQLRWKLSDAMDTVIWNLLDDTTLTADEKTALLATSLDQYKALMLDWFGKVQTATKGSPAYIESKAVRNMALINEKPDNSTSTDNEPQPDIKSLDLSHLLANVKSLNEMIGV